MVPTNRALRMALIVASLSIALFLVSLNSSEDGWIAHADEHEIVPQIENQPMEGIGTVGDPRKRIEVIVVESSIPLTETLTITLVVTPKGAAQLYAEQDATEPLDPATLDIEVGQTSVPFFVEWIETGQIIIKATTPDEQLGYSTFVISPEVPADEPVDEPTAIPTALDVTQTFIGRNDQGSSATGYDYELVVSQSAPGSLATPFETGTKLTLSDISDPEKPVIFKAVGHEIVDGVIVTGAPVASITLRVRIPEGKSSAELKFKTRNLQGHPFVLDAEPVKVKVLEPEPAASFDGSLASPPINIQFLSRWDLPLSLSNKLPLVFELFDGTDKINKVWVTPDGEDRSADDGRISVSSDIGNFTIKYEASKNVPSPSARSLKLCVRFESETSSSSCEGINLGNPAEVVVVSSKGGVILAWPSTINEFLITVSALSGVKFSLSAAAPETLKTSVPVMSDEGSATTSIRFVCGGETSGQECNVRIWITTVDEIDENSIFSVEVTDNSYLTRLIARAQFEASKMSDQSVPDAPKAIIETKDEIETVYIIPAPENGGSDQSFHLVYQTKDGEGEIHLNLKYSDWIELPGGAIKPEGAINSEQARIWTPPGLATGDRLTELSITPHNQIGYGDTVLAEKLGQGFFSNIPWPTVGIWAAVSVVVMIGLWAARIEAHKKQRKQWLAALIPGSEDDKIHELKTYVENPDNRDNEMRANFVETLALRSKKELDGYAGAALVKVGFGKTQIYELAKKYAAYDITRYETEKTTAEAGIRRARVEKKEADKESVDTQTSLKLLKTDLDTRNSKIADLDKKFFDHKEKLQLLINRIDAKQTETDKQEERFGERKTEITRQKIDLQNAAQTEFDKFRTKKDLEKSDLTKKFEEYNKTLQDKINSANQDLTTIKADGYQHLLDDAVEAVVSTRILEELSATGRVNRSANLQDLVTKLSALQNDGLELSSTGRPGDITISHPSVNDLSTMRQLISSSLQAFGAWLVSSTTVTSPQPTDPQPPRPAAIDPADLMTDLAQIENDHGDEGYGLASGLERIIALSRDRLSNQSGDQRARGYTEESFWKGASEAVTMLTGSAIDDVYPEFINTLGLEDDELEGVQVGKSDRGPADALARYVAADWFAQQSDTTVASITTSTMRLLGESRNDQNFTAQYFKNNVIVNLGLRWSYQEDEAWSTSQMAGFGIICDFMVRYISATVLAPWSGDA